MAYCDNKLNNFNVIFSEQLNNQMQVTSSSSSSTSSKSSGVDTIVKAEQIKNVNISISTIESSCPGSVLKQPNNSDERKKELYKKKEEKLILKFKKEEAAKLQAVGQSKCGRFIKYDCKIGEGGYKIVNKGFDKDACCAIAWCEVKREHLDSKEKNQSMLKEIEIMLKLDHPNVVKCYAVLKDWLIIRDDSSGKKCEGKGLVIIQELMGAGTLKEMINKNFHDGRCILDIRLITRWLYQILDVLRYMHSRIQPPIIHRDVKSENCFLVEQNDEDFVSVKIGDFGLATTINHNSQRKTMIGTVGFMAPEVFEENYDNKVDIYAFGMMVLEVMTNKTPYDDCTNVFQVVSKSMGTHLPDVISAISPPSIKEIILMCVHPVPTYRPSAEELCEHSIFQNNPLIVELNVAGCHRSDAVAEVVQRLSSKIKSPIIDLIISMNPDFVQQQSCQMNFNVVTFSLDVYQAQKCDLSELMDTLNSYIETEFKSSHKKLNQSKKLNECARLQILYLIKLINGGRWRKIFEDFLHKENEERRNHRSNSTPSQRNITPEVERLIPSSSLNQCSVDRYSNNFSDYSSNVAVFHRATESFEEEIEEYCYEAKKKQKPYFFNVYSKNENNDRSQVAITPKNSTELLINNVNGSKKEPTVPSRFEKSKSDTQMHQMSSTDTLAATDEVFMSPTDTDSKDSLKRFVKAEVYSSADSSNEEEITVPIFDYRTFPNADQTYYHDDIDMSIFPQHTDTWNDQYFRSNVGVQGNYGQSYHGDNWTMNLMPSQNNYDINQSVGYEYFYYRPIQEPKEVIGSNLHSQMDHTYPIRNNSQLEYKTILPESYYSQFTFHEEQSPTSAYGYNCNLQTSIQPTYDNTPLQQSQCLINYTQPVVSPGQNKLIFASQNPLLSANVSDIYNCNQVQSIDPHSQTMQTNNPYPAPLELNSRNPISVSQPVLTRSLPSIVGNVPTYFDNVAVSGIYQSYVSSVSTATVSQSTVLGSYVIGNDNGLVSQRPTVVPNCSQSQILAQKFNLPVISSPKTTSVRQQSSHSTIISNSKILEKSRKKSKPRLKSKYLLKLINIQENDNVNDTIVTFEMMLPMHQMRFTCCLSNEFNSRDVSNSVGESGQIPGELGKKDILESLVNTVKKICLCLSEDVHSIPLNEDYVFHPCLPNSGLIKLSDYGFSISMSLDSEGSQTSSSLNQNQSFQPFSTFTNSFTSSTSLSRQPSSEDVSLSIGNMSMSMSEQLSGHFTENDLIVFTENDSTMPSTGPIEVESKFQPMVPIKCDCPMSESSIKVPEYLFVTLKHTVERLLNLHCKGLIILPSSNDILTRNYRVLEIPADHMFVGLPCSDSSYNVIKGQKDKDFIIAKDNRDSDNVSGKCVYQKPSSGAVLLDSSGEIQYIQKPSLIIPSKPGSKHEKTIVKELPSELTHHNDQILDCDQLMSVLQSLSQIQNSSSQNKDELFDSPILLEPTKALVPKLESDKPDLTDNISSMTQAQSQIQVERIFCQYVTMPKMSDTRHDNASLVTDTIDRDLPRQNVRSRKISNESLDSISTSRARSATSVPVVNELDLNQPQKPHHMGTFVNAMPPVPRLTSLPGSAPYLLANQNPNNSMSGNIFIQNHPIYSNSSQGSSSGVNFCHGLPNQVVLPVGMMSPNPGVRMPVQPSLMGMGSNQILQQNQMSSGGHVHHQSIPQQSYQSCDNNDASLVGLGRQLTMTNVRQGPQSISSSQYFDKTMMSDNLRLQHLNQTPANAQFQPQASVVNVTASSTNSVKSSDTSSNQNTVVKQSDSHPKNQKSEQTIGRFVVRPVVDGSGDN